MDLNEIRPDVINAAIQMERVLRKNDSKPGWHKCQNSYLLIRFFEEVEEVKLLNENGFPCKMGNCGDFEITDELADAVIDVMNFGMMRLSKRCSVKDLGEG